MNNEKTLKNLHKLKDKYGDISISELIEKINQESESIPVGKIKIDYVRRYGRGCNELAGEYNNGRVDSLIELLEDITNYRTTMVNTTKYRQFKDKKTYYTLEDNEDGFTEKLAQAIHNGYLGNSFEVSYELTFVDRTPTVEEIKAYLKRVRVDYDALYDLERIIK